MSGPTAKQNGAGGATTTAANPGHQQPEVKKEVLKRTPFRIARDQLPGGMGSSNRIDQIGRAGFKSMDQAAGKGNISVINGISKELPKTGEAVAKIVKPADDGNIIKALKDSGKEINDSKKEGDAKERKASAGKVTPKKGPKVPEKPLVRKQSEEKASQRKTSDKRVEKAGTPAPQKKSSLTEAKKPLKKTSSHDTRANEPSKKEASAAAKQKALVTGKTADKKIEEGGKERAAKASSGNLTCEKDVKATSNEYLADDSCQSENGDEVMINRDGDSEVYFGGAAKAADDDEATGPLDLAEYRPHGGKYKDLQTLLKVGDTNLTLNYLFNFCNKFK